MKKLISLLLISTFGLNAQNTLSKLEKKQGFRLLFDGKTLNGWRNYKSNTINSAWQVKDAALTLTSKNGGDIITNEKYESFELLLDWKISDCGNSGIFYHVIEDSSFNAVYSTGPEMQILDDTCHPDNKWVTHRAGALYDMIAVSKVTVKKAGEWNKVKLIVNNGNVQHWLNGVKVVEYTLFTKEWKTMVEKSKFNDWKGFGEFKSGHIALQDHGDVVSFRNIKIRKL